MIRYYYALSELDNGICDVIPRAMPWAVILRSFGAKRINYIEI